MGTRAESCRCSWSSLLWPRQAVLAGVRVFPALLLQTALLLIGFYQRFISPGLRPCCRFVPSCSTYAQECLKKHGLLKGTAKAIWRLLRCHPLCKGGLDQP